MRRMRCMSSDRETCMRRSSQEENTCGPNNHLNVISSRAAMCDVHNVLINHSSINILDAISPTIQSMPSANPSPVTALHFWTLWCRVFISLRSKILNICSGFKAFGRSCLFVKISKDAPASLCFSEKYISAHQDRTGQ